MQRLRYWRPLAAALLVCLAVPGCGSSGHPKAGTATDVRSVAPGSGSAVGGSTAPGSGSAPGGSAGAGGASVPGGSAATGGARASSGSARTGGATASGKSTTAGAGAPGAPGSSGSADAPGAPGGNGQPGSGGGLTAPGAPITIPDIIHLFRQSPEAAIKSLEDGIPLPGETNPYLGIIPQCPDHKTLCVTIKVKVGTTHPELTLCEASGVTEPPLKSVIYPGATIWVLTGPQPCTPSQTPYPPSPSPGGGQSSASPGGSHSPKPSAGQSPTATSTP